MSSEAAQALAESWIERAVLAFCRARDARVRFERALAKGTL